MSDLLEVCDSEKLQGVAKTEMNLQESGSEFEDDFAIITGRKKVKTKQISREKQQNSSSESEDAEDDYNDHEENDVKKILLKGKSFENKNKSSRNKASVTVKNEIKDDEYDSDDFVDSEEDMDDFSDEESISDETNKTILQNNEAKNTLTKDKQKKIVGEKVIFAKETVPHSMEKPKIENTSSDLESESEYYESDEKQEKIIALNKKNRKRNISFEYNEIDQSKKRKTEDSDGSDDDSDKSREDSVEENGDELWEDIYGRTRDKKGNVVQVI